MVNIVDHYSAVQHAYSQLTGVVEGELQGRDRTVTADNSIGPLKTTHVAEFCSRQLGHQRADNDVLKSHIKVQINMYFSVFDGPATHQARFMVTEVKLSIAHCQKILKETERKK